MKGWKFKGNVGVFFYMIPFVVLGFFYLAYRLSGKHKEILFGLLFFLITVSPAITIGKYEGVGVFVGDRYTYAPMLGTLRLCDRRIVFSHPILHLSNYPLSSFYSF